MNCALRYYLFHHAYQQGVHSAGFGATFVFRSYNLKNYVVITSPKFTSILEHYPLCPMALCTPSGRLLHQKHAFIPFVGDTQSAQKLDPGIGSLEEFWYTPEIFIAL